MIVIGIGSNSLATAGDIAAAISAAEVSAGVTADRIATLARGAPDRAIIEAARLHGCEVVLLSVIDLLLRSSQCVTRSAASLAAHGVPSMAEASALAAAGPGSRLTMPRLQRERVTAAVATSQDTTR